jgi:hypothetical protein
LPAAWAGENGSSASTPSITAPVHPRRPAAHLPVATHSRIIEPRARTKAGRQCTKKKMRNNNQLRIFIEAAIEGSGLP